MNASIKALESLLFNYQPQHSQPAFLELSAIILTDEDFLGKVKKFDAAIAKHNVYSEIGEYAFDLMMIHHLSNFIKDEDYLDSKEWLDIEDKTIERGTELLNVLLYISEVKDSEVDISIDDFLYEFLLVDEDEFQDEHRIYEDLIVNQDLVEESLENIIRISSEIVDSTEIKELFTPLILFFQSPNEKLLSKDIYNRLKPAERSVLGCLLAFNNG
jgi:hypothetical protein